MNVDGDEIHDVSVDNRGRVTLGAEYTNEHVVVGLVNENPEQSDGRVEVEVDLDSIRTVTVGGGGRVSIGSEHAGEDVVVAVLERQ
ncbi:hypothetical protein [Halorubrum halophilum]|uniref:hypothetical protein n=1 Tax=Halorubrum halophilum TaxID=413816 RepID=UPI00186B2238|nr:hypothetical protein [Halorubrum halophilum]